MTSTERCWMTPAARDRLKAELAELLAQRNLEVPDDAVDAHEHAGARRHALRMRIQQIHDLLANAAVGEEPPDDGIAEPGMVLTVRYDDTGDAETFLLGVRGAEETDIEVYTIQSPLGSAIAGARPGEQRTYTVPSGAVIRVTLLKAVPYGVHVSQPSEAAKAVAG